MFRYKYLSDDHLRGFDKYTYNAIDTSPLSKYVMHPFWNKIVDYTPNWIAPNLLTFSGFLFMIADAVLFSYYDYHYNATNVPGSHGKSEDVIPNWVFTVAGVFLFFAYTLDGIDGKQARKTGVSGPLGELFDHGLDSWIVFFIPFCLFSIYGTDHWSLTHFRLFLCVLSVVLNFHVSHIEKYNTGALYLPWGYDLSMWASTLLFLTAGILGPGFFKFKLWSLRFIDYMEFTIHFTGLFTTLPIALYNIYLSYKNKTGKMRSFWEAIRPLWSILTVTTTYIYWLRLSPNNIIKEDLRCCLLLYGTLFSQVSTRLIASQMSGQRCELVCWLLWPLISGLAVSMLQPKLEFLCLYALTMLSVLAHTHYGICVVKQLCSHFRIYCFKLQKRNN